MGAGPSLNSIDTSKLKGATIIFTNASYKLAKKIQTKTSYHFVMDVRRVSEIAEYIKKDLFNIRFRSLTTIPTSFSELRKMTLNMDYFLMPRSQIKKKNKFLNRADFVVNDAGDVDQDISLGIKLRSSVVFNAVDIAFYMGANKVILLGVDVNYSENVRTSYFDQENRQHFYIKDLYKDFIKPNLISYNKYYNNEKYRILNASHPTNDDVLPKMDMCDVYDLYK
jgi:hypothetical protein